MIVKFKAYITLLDKIVDVEKIDFRKQVLSFNDERRFHQLEWFLDDCVLLQFTGVEDTFHKREVYNGDIYRQWYYPDHKAYTVEFEGGGFS